jgi:hypothetical protein
MPARLRIISDPKQRQTRDLLKSGEKSADKLGSKFDISPLPCLTPTKEA